MAMDLDRFNKRRAEDAGKSERFKKEERAEFFGMKDPGHYCVYLCPPNIEMDEGNDPFIRVVMHYRVGSEQKMHVCLDKSNEAVWSKPVQDAIVKRNASVAKDHPDWVVELDEEAGCPTCDECGNENSEYNERQLQDMRASEFYLCSVIRFWYMNLAAKGQAPVKVEVPIQARTPQPWFAKPLIKDAIAGFITANNLDITDPAKAILVQVKRVGKTFKDTRYTTSLDATTMEKRMAMSPPIRAAIRTTEPGGPNDLHKLIANLVRPYDQIVGWLTGTQTQESKTEDDPEGPPACFKKDCAPADEFCQQCAWKVECAEACGTAVPGEEAKAPETRQEARKPEPTRQAPSRPGSAAAAQQRPGNGASRGTSAARTIQPEPPAEDDLPSSTPGTTDDDFDAALESELAAARQK